MAEVLSALAILGLIAAFTIPKLLGVSENNQKSLVLRESIVMMNQIIEQGVTNQSISYTNISSFVLNRVNAVRLCPTDSSTEGCWDAAIQGVYSAEYNQPGFVLANGARIAGFDNAADTGNGDWENGFMIDWNGVKGPNVVGDDILWLAACFGPADCNHFTDAKTGTIAPCVKTGNCAPTAAVTQQAFEDAFATN